MSSFAKIQVITTLIINMQIEYISDTIELWLMGKAKTTRRVYFGYIKRFLAFLPDKELSAIALVDVAKYERNLRDKTDNPNTIRINLKAIQSFIKYLSRNSLVDSGEAAKIDSYFCPKESAPITERLLTKEEVDKLLAIAVDKTDRLMIVVFLSLGLRISELISLQWKDIRGNHLTVIGKGNKARHLVLSPNLIRELESNPKYGKFIFTEADGTRIDTWHCYRRFKALVKDAGINEKASPHWLRHYHAIAALKNGCPINILQNTLGHSSLDTTNRYLHVLPQECSSNFVSF